MRGYTLNADWSVTGNQALSNVAVWGQKKPAQAPNLEPWGCWEWL